MTRIDGRGPDLCPDHDMARASASYGAWEGSWFAFALVVALAAGIVVALVTATWSGTPTTTQGSK